MKSVVHWLLPTTLLALFTCTASHSQELTWDSDFSRGLRGWVLGDGSELRREGARLYLRLQGPMGNEIAECKSPILRLDGAEHEYELTSTFRTDVEQSHLHGGAWFIFHKLDADKKLVGDWTGLPLRKSADWTTAKTTVRIPVGVKTFQVDIRIQGRKGKTLDVRTVSLKKIR